MRIVGGRYRGRKLSAPDDRTIRPTTDRMRERMFNILQHSPHLDWPPARVCDLFAGTGALGLEALSRGAQHVAFVDMSAQALRLVRANLAALGEAADVIRADASRLPAASAPYDLVMMDPPYAKGLAIPAIASALARGYLAPSALIALEQGADDPLDLPAELTVLSQKAQGVTKFYLIGRSI